MFRYRITIIWGLALSGLLCADVLGQHLWWDLEGEKDGTCLYGEITVLATQPGIYYCGANWHPGAPAGGYCGIQHNAASERRTIFSIWDTSALLHPSVTVADSKTVSNRFGGEGQGAHTHMLWQWQAGATFQFFVYKQPGKGDTTDTRYYAHDPRQKAWLRVAAINSPNGGQRSVATIGGGLNSFLENFLGRNRGAAKVALYRLWLGTSLERIKCLTRAQGDGIWGVWHDCYFLAEGDNRELEAVFASWRPKYGAPVLAAKGAKLEPLSEKAMSAELFEGLKTKVCPP